MTFKGAMHNITFSSVAQFQPTNATLLFLESLRSSQALVHDIHSKVDKWSKVVVEGGAFALDQINSDPSSSDANWISADLISKLCPNLKLAPYQVVGVNWLAVLSRQRFRGKDVNGIIGDEMGLGKTVQTIAFLRWFKEYGGGIEEKEVRRRAREKVKNQ